jgi:hypothetical protein
MPIEELCEHLLAYMAQLTQKRGQQRGIPLNDVAREKWGIRDLLTVQAALEGLVRQGYAEDMRISGCVMAQLTAEGLARYENGGEVVLGRGNVTVDNSTTFHGPVSGSNIAIHSRDVSQSQVNSRVEDLLDQIVETLRHDSSLSEGAREDALSDTDSLRREVAQERPRQSRVREFLGGLGNISSITSLFIQLRQIVNQLPLR